MREMNTYLMLAARVEFTTHQRVVRRGVQYAETCSSSQAFALLSDAHFNAKWAWISGERLIHQALLWHTPGDREVNFVAALRHSLIQLCGPCFGFGASLELHFKQAIRLRTLGEHEDAAGLSVEAMDERKKLLRALSLQRANHGVPVMTRRWMHRHEWGFVHDEQMFVFKNCRDLAGGRGLVECGAPQSDAVFSFDAFGRFETPSIHGKGGIVDNQRSACATRGSQLCG